VFQVDFGEGFVGDPHRDQAWPDRLTAARVQRIDDTVENNRVDVVFAVEFPDGRQGQDRELRDSTGVQRFYLRRRSRLLDNRVSALDISVRLGLRDDINRGQLVLDHQLARIRRIRNLGLWLDRARQR
jgi:hypothetical protein